MPSRMTISTRNNRAVIANLKRYSEQARERARVVVQESADRTYNTSKSLAPVDTGFMADHLRKEITPGGYGYQVGFRQGDFTGAGKEFYPVFVLFGTRFMPGRDFLFAPNEGEKARFRQNLRQALRPR